MRDPFTYIYLLQKRESLSLIFLHEVVDLDFIWLRGSLHRFWLFELVDCFENRVHFAARLHQFRR